MAAEQKTVDATEELRSRYHEIAALAGGFAHELRNPLSTMGLHLEILAEELSPPGDSRDHRLLERVKKIRGECGQLDHILKAFLDFAHAGQPQLQPGDLSSVVGDFVEYFRPRAERAGLDLRPHLDQSLPSVEVDPTLINQMLLNLALNASQAMPDGGTLELITRLGMDGIELFVIDNGPGIDEATRDRMFEPFVSTKPEGSGLGLPTVARIVAAHGGTIECESEPGKGTRFRVWLPTSD
ncbi:two-component system sensor histidine kinase NtrB [Stratiformator vulcanicus]|uniref:histidine kinase n=1 Tax=Stratiformator vulcanicus TaxID=2527980 RepID=A0A517QW23_9PLAN|nr:ATP-binding protein [Stratiformator vulcanicus]QDT35865.1 Sensor protein ZraS [Stratiformator vulcanicus]